MPDNKFKDAASSTPDPERAYNNLVSFCDANPERIEQVQADIRPISLLFSCSQFLANFASAHPDALFDALKKVHAPVQNEVLATSFGVRIHELPALSWEDLLGRVRKFKKKILLLIT